jgi:2'-5' RNA ligase
LIAAVMRLFVAADLPEGEKRRLEALGRRQDWFGLGDGFRPVRAENLHLTLKFLGEVPDDRVARVCDGLKRIEWPASLTLRTEGVTFFPPRGPINVFVAQFGGDVERLRQLHADIEAALQPLGFPRDARPFKPHVTLLRGDHRRKPAGAVREAVAKNPPKAGEPFAVSSFALFQSRLKPTGPEYVALAHFGS